MSFVMVLDKNPLERKFLSNSVSIREMNILMG